MALEVENKIFVHVHTLNNVASSPNRHSEKWVIGGELFFGQENNNDKNIFHETIYGPHIDLGREEFFIRNLSKKIISLSSPSGFDEIENLFLKKSMLHSYFQFAREVVLEEVRKIRFPQKASRSNAIWLSDFAYKERWLEIFSAFGLSYKVFLVSFTGKIHKADARWLTNIDNPLSITSYYKNADGYWNGGLQSSNGIPDEEYIGSGRIKIIQEIT